MAANDVKKIYEGIIDDVCKNVKNALQEEGFDDQTLKDLRKAWSDRLNSSRALEPLPVSDVDAALHRNYARPTNGDTTNNKHTTATASAASKVNHRINPTTNSMSFIPTTSATIMNAGMISTMNQGQTQFARPNYSTPTNIGNGTMNASKQLDGTIDELIRKKKSKKTIEISFQVDGTGPPMGDDDDDDDESEAEGNDVNDDIDDEDDDDGNEEGGEEQYPLCSDDDVSDDEPEKLFETDNIILCQYDKITRTKSKWRFNLKSGVMNIEGRDYVFSKATGDADW